MIVKIITVSFAVSISAFQLGPAHAAPSAIRNTMNAPTRRLGRGAPGIAERGCRRRR
jgi:hypothetical protein